MEQSHFVTSASHFLHRAQRACGTALCSARSACETHPVCSRDVPWWGQEFALRHRGSAGHWSHSWLTALHLASFLSSSFLEFAEEVSARQESFSAAVILRLRRFFTLTTIGFRDFSTNDLKTAALQFRE